MMFSFFNTPWNLGRLILPNRLIQGPLAGYSCAPLRRLFNQYTAPAYCVSEMVSAHDVVYKHSPNSRYLYRADDERYLCYQIAGTDSIIMADAAAKLQQSGADLIDINCGCPKTKIRKKGAGSALLEKPEQLFQIIAAVRQAVTCPLTVKIRIQNTPHDFMLAEGIAKAGADGLIVHGRRWTDDYNVACDLERIAAIKQTIKIPVIANGDIADKQSLSQAYSITQCDAFMVSRAGTGKPWLFQQLLSSEEINIDWATKVQLFKQHLDNLVNLEGEYQAVLQSKSLGRYYFRQELSVENLQLFYRLNTIADIFQFLSDQSIEIV